ncbi:MAG: hypothetical protein ABIW46_02025 [Acidimicrobiales bacterium]
MDEVDALLADLARWSGESRTATAAQARTRERWLRQQAAEDARFTGLLVDLAERELPLSLVTTSGQVSRGRVRAVAADFVVVASASDGGTTSLVRLDAIATLRLEPGFRQSAVAADRPAPLATTFAEVLAGLAEERPRVRAVADGAGTLTGELRAVGTDVVTIRLDGEPPSSVYVRLAAVSQVTLL